MTESNLFCSASLVKSLPKLSRIGVLDFSLVLGVLEEELPFKLDISSSSIGSDDVLACGLLV